MGAQTADRPRSLDRLSYLMLVCLLGLHRSGYTPRPTTVNGPSRVRNERGDDENSFNIPATTRIGGSSNRPSIDGDSHRDVNLSRHEEIAETDDSQASLSQGT